MSVRAAVHMQRLQVGFGESQCKPGLQIQRTKYISLRPRAYVGFASSGES
jgi:hypothetical protein